MSPPYMGSEFFGQLNRVLGGLPTLTRTFGHTVRYLTLNLSRPRSRTFCSHS